MKLVQTFKAIYSVLICILLAFLLFLMVRKLWYEAYPPEHRVYPKVECRDWINWNTEVN